MEARAKGVTPLDRDDRFDGLKRRFFLVMLPIISMGGFADWLMDQTAGSPSRPASLPAILIPLALALLLWRKRRSLRFVEAATFTWALATLLSLFYGVLFLYKTDLAERFTSISPWFSVCLIAVFLVFGPRRATWISVGLYLLVLGLGLTYFVKVRTSGADPVLIRPLIHLYLANAAFITFLTYYGRVREQFERTHSLARSMADLAHSDPLLGIANRRHMYTIIRQEISLAEDGAGKPSILIMFDLDRFKEVNDTYGHDTGDEVLKTVAAVVTQTLRGSDRFGRWGGDEFVVLARVADISQANMLAQRLRDAVHQRLAERLWRVTISLGVAPYHRGDTVESWVKRADQALYRAKEAGKNRVVVG
ncbi:MAG: diguanylate cyclase [Bacillota bacterium]